MIYLVLYRDAVPVYNLEFILEIFQARYKGAYREKMGKKYEDRWSETKDTAMEHLKSCSGPDLEVLKTVMLG